MKQKKLKKVAVTRHSNDPLKNYQRPTSVSLGRKLSVEPKITSLKFALKDKVLNNLKKQKK